jgi:hypothetical protein
VGCLDIKDSSCSDDYIRIIANELADYGDRIRGRHGDFHNVDTASEDGFRRKQSVSRRAGAHSGNDPDFFDTCNHLHFCHCLAILLYSSDNRLPDAGTESARMDQGFTWLKMDLGTDMIQHVPGALTRPLREPEMRFQ